MWEILVPPSLSLQKVMLQLISVSLHLCPIQRYCLLGCQLVLSVTPVVTIAPCWSMQFWHLSKLIG